MIGKIISDPRSLRLWCIKTTRESLLRVDSLVPLMHHDPNDLSSIIPFLDCAKEMHPKLPFHFKCTIFCDTR